MKFIKFLAFVIFANLQTPVCSFAAPPNFATKKEVTQNYYDINKRNLKKAIMSIDITKEVRIKIQKEEDTLDNTIDKINIDFENRLDAKLSSMFKKTGFDKKKFLEISRENSEKVENATLKYFESIYNILSVEEIELMVQELKKLEAK